MKDRIKWYRRTKNEEYFEEDNILFKKSFEYQLYCLARKKEKAMQTFLGKKDLWKAWTIVSFYVLFFDLKEDREGLFRYFCITSDWFELLAHLDRITCWPFLLKKCQFFLFVICFEHILDLKVLKLAHIVEESGVTWCKLTWTIKNFKKCFILTNFFILIKGLTF